MRVYLVLGFLMLCLHGFAQPGGGGGMRIMNLYDQKGNKIELTKDTPIKIRSFVLQDTSAYGNILYETFCYEAYFVQDPSIKYRLTHAHYYNTESCLFLPPHEEYKRKIEQNSHHRLMITYQEDTMIIDFLYVSNENGAGWVDKVDSIVIQHGYFRNIMVGLYFLPAYSNCLELEYKPENQMEWDACIKMQNLEMKCRSWGVTPATLQQVSDFGLLQRLSGVNDSFLLKSNLPPYYYLRRSDYYGFIGKTDLAMRDLHHYLDSQQGNQHVMVAYGSLAYYYSMFEEWEKVEKYLSLMVKSLRSGVNYFGRIRFYLKMDQIEKAAMDYSALVETWRGRALITIDYLRGLIASKSNVTHPNYKINDKTIYPKDPSIHRTKYYELGRVAYLKSQEKEAFKYWLQAEEFGYQRSGRLSSLLHFDSLIQKHPKVFELYLARGIAHSKRGPHLKPGQWESCYEQALFDLDMAERLDTKDNRVNLFRALVLIEQRKHQDALTQIDIAISKDKTDTRGYMVRYIIRKYLKLTPRNEFEDADVMEFERLIAMPAPID